MRRLPPLATLRAFEAAARHVSFKRAAEELAVTPTAISHQIRSLEDVLGQRLFERRTRHVAMTTAGQILYAPLRAGFDTIAEAVERVRALKTTGIVTLTATMAFTSKWLIPRVAAFRNLYPDINLRLLASDDVLDLWGGAADIAIRYGGDVYANCRTDPMFREAFAPVCSPRLAVRVPAELAGHSLIHSEWRHVDERAPLWSRWFAEAKLPYPHAGGHILFSDEAHAIQAAVAGQGVALSSMTFVTDEIAAGLLTIPFGPALQGHEFRIVTRNGSDGDRNVAAVREWLADEARAFGAHRREPS